MSIKREIFYVTVNVLCLNILWPFWLHHSTTAYTFLTHPVYDTLQYSIVSVAVMTEYEKKLTAAGVHCELHLAKGAVHGFSTMPGSHACRSSFLLQKLSRVCAVAQNAVLEANAKVSGRGPFSHPHPSETPQPISMSCQIYYYVPQESWCAKFGWNRFGSYGSAHAWKKHDFVWIFLLTYLSVCPFLRRGYRSQFCGDFNA